METGSNRTQRALAAGCGVFVAVIGAVPLVFILVLFFSGGRQLWPLLLVCVLAFGGIVAWGVRDAVRRWREVAELQEMLGEMDEEERKEFDEAIEHSDVEIVEDDKGRRHSVPLDHG